MSFFCLCVFVVLTITICGGYFFFFGECILIWAFLLIVEIVLLIWTPVFRKLTSDIRNWTFFPALYGFRHFAVFWKFIDFNILLFSENCSEIWYWPLFRNSKKNTTSRIAKIQEPDKTSQKAVNVGGGRGAEICEYVTKKITRMLKTEMEKNTAKSQIYFLSLYWGKKKALLQLSSNSGARASLRFSIILARPVPYQCCCSVLRWLAGVLVHVLCE